MLWQLTGLSMHAESTLWNHIGAREIMKTIGTGRNWLNKMKYLELWKQTTHEALEVLS